MAKINPDIQDAQLRDYRESRPSEVGSAIREQGEAKRDILPKGESVGDESGKYAYAAIGDAVSGAANLFDTAGKVGDFYVKQDIDQKVYSKVDKERNDITQAYEIATGAIIEGPTGKPLNILPGSGVEGQAGVDVKTLPTDVASIDRVVGGW